MFAEKQKLVADLEAYGPGGKIVHLVETPEAPSPATQTKEDAEPSTEENPPEGESN